MQLSRRWTIGWCAALLVALAAPAAAVRAADGADKYFPEGTTVVVRINFNQLFGSPLLRKAVPLVVDKYGEDFMNLMATFAATQDENAAKAMKEAAPQLKEAVKDPEKVAAFMDRLKDAVTDVVVAGDPKGGDEKMVFIVRSKFLNAGMVAMVAQMAENNPAAKLKSEKIEGGTLYEVEVPNQDKKVYGAVVEDGVIVASPEKDMVVAALKGKGKPSKLSADFQAMLAKRSEQQTLFVATLEDDAKSVFTLTVGDDITGSFNVEAKDADAAKEKAKEIDEGIDHMKDFLGGLLDDSKPELKPLGEALGKLKAEVNGKNVNVKLQIKGEMLLKALKSKGD